MRRIVPILFLLLAACDSSDERGEETAVAPPELRTLFRQSVEFRSARDALAINESSLASDIARTNRMLSEIEAYLRVPIAPDPAADAEALRNDLTRLGREIGAGPLAVEITTRPAPEPVPSELSTEIALEYSDDQIAGIHDVVVTIPDGLLNGSSFRAALPDFARLFVCTGATIGANGAAIVSGEVAFFRSLEPVTFVLPTVDVEALLIEAVGEPLPTHLPDRDIIADIRANYAGSEERGAASERALANEALIEINTARFRWYSGWVDRFNAAPGWSGLLRADRE